MNADKQILGDHPLVPRISREQITKLAAFMLRCGYMKNKPLPNIGQTGKEVTNGNVWAIEHILRDCGIPFEEHNESLKRLRAADSLDGASL